MAASDLAIDSADAVIAGQLNWEHRDPFDRMIVAQATRRGLTIATSDKIVQDVTLTPVIDTRR
jgi:PIN domain nuclease of toxin-antitoxin system